MPHQPPFTGHQLRERAIDILYAAALGHDGRPYLWQRELATRAWPEVLSAPTGAGKTAAVVLGWMVHRLRVPGTPRRLVWCLPTRALVEQTADAISMWCQNIHDRCGDHVALPGPDDVHVLMGGAKSERWFETPERAAVIVGTQDMLLSRALMRGYASGRAIWPMEFALLHHDALWVFDEVQLMGAGRATSAQLEAFRRDESTRRNDGHGAPVKAQSLWVSATLDPGWLQTVDFPAPTGEAVMPMRSLMEDDDRTQRLLHAPKRLSPALPRPRSASTSDERAYLDELADLVLDEHAPGTLTLVLLNRVQRAQALHSRLVKAVAAQERGATTIVLLHGRFRPAERREALRAAGDTDTDRIVVATQAVEAGVDLSAALLITELAPWPSLVQRFGRANRYAELPAADIRWVDLLGDIEGSDHDAIALPYRAEDLEDARARLGTLVDAAPACLPPVTELQRSRRVLRRKDLYDLFNTDPDLTGFDVDVSAYIRDGDDVDIRVFWRDLGAVGDGPLRPTPEELCCAPIRAASDWLKAVRKAEKAGQRRLLFVSDPQARGEQGLAASGWAPFTEHRLWPGMTLLADVAAGGYSTDAGFTGNVLHRPEPLDSAGENDYHTESRLTRSAHSGESDLHGADPLSEGARCVTLANHLAHVEKEAGALCGHLGIAGPEKAALLRAARWHDLGKIHEVFQDTMRRGLPDDATVGGEPLAKTVKSKLRHSRPYFRHELASALAFLASTDWNRNGDLVAYLVAAHHGKVRMSLRALPKERQPAGDNRQDVRFARGIHEDDELPAFDLGGGEVWQGGQLTLSVMELGESPQTRQSWTERTHDLLAEYGPFRLAWLETILRVADWRASAKERQGAYDDAL